MARPDYLCSDAFFSDQLAICKVYGDTEKYWKINLRGELMLVRKSNLLLRGCHVQFVAMSEVEVRNYRERQSLISKFRKIKPESLSNDLLVKILDLVDGGNK